MTLTQINIPAFHYKGEDDVNDLAIFGGQYNAFQIHPSKYIESGGVWILDNYGQERFLENGNWYVILNNAEDIFEDTSNHSTDGTMDIHLIFSDKNFQKLNGKSK